MNYIDLYNFWKTDEFFDASIRTELNALDLERSAKEIEDGILLRFGVWHRWLRRIIGAGTNSMNKYMVRKATKGLENYLLDTYGVEACENSGVVIGYDTRNNSEFFCPYCRKCVEQ